MWKLEKEVANLDVYSKKLSKEYDEFVEECRKNLDPDDRSQQFETNIKLLNMEGKISETNDNIQKKKNEIQNLIEGMEKNN